MKQVLRAAALVATFIGITAASAQIFPTRPITIVVPFAAGGPADAMARVIGDRMRVSLGQQVIIENVAGDGGPHGGRRGWGAPRATATPSASATGAPMWSMARSMICLMTC